MFSYQIYCPGHFQSSAGPQRQRRKAAYGAAVMMGSPAREPHKSNQSERVQRAPT